MKLNLPILFFFFFTLSLSGQDQRKADSLAIIYNAGSYKGDELELLKEIIVNSSNPPDQLKFANLLIEKASVDSVFNFLYSGYLEKGNALVQMGDFDQALEAYLTGLYCAQKNNDEQGIGKLMISIADTYSEVRNSRNAEKYYAQGISILRKSNDSISLGSALFNAGDEAYNAGNYELALSYFEESGEIFEDYNFLLGKAYNLGNIGRVYAKQGKNEIAEIRMNEAISILEKLEDFTPISEYLISLSEIYAEQNDLENAITTASKSMDIAIEYGLKDQISEANLQLSKLHEKNQNTELALAFYKNHITYRDSVRDLETIEKMADLRTEYEVSQKQIEVDLLHERSKNQTNAMIGIGSILVLISFMAFMLNKRNKEIRKSHKIIEEEKNKSENLLLNILPADTAEELKKHGKVKARKHENVTVLFTDFVNFTHHSQQLTPEEIVESVDYFFSSFDKIIEKHHLEKIKTIGDAYMCVGGLPLPYEGSAINAVSAAIEMARFVEKSRENKKLPQFKIRLGLNTGTVVGGVVGTKKFVYDIWGDAVNIASRMESLSVAGKINISESTYLKVKDQFNCIYRGEIDVKNKGKMKMYFVDYHLK